MMSTVLDAGPDVQSLRKRPKQGKKRPQAKHAPFGGDARKLLPIPECFNGYNFNMGAVDGVDQLVSNNRGLRHVKRGVFQALEDWLLLIILTNTYVITQTVRKEKEEVDGLTKLRSQQAHRQAIIDGLIELSKQPSTSLLSKKRRISHTNPDADVVPVRQHTLIKMQKKGRCVCCAGHRFGWRPQKRKALCEIGADHNVQTVQKTSFYGCKECSIYLCKIRDCFDRYHQNR